MDAALAENIYYDVAAKRYRYSNPSNVPGIPISGTFVSRKEIIRLQQNYLEKVTSEFLSLSPRMLRGEIGIYREAGDLLKKIHVSNAIIAADGIDRLSQSQLGKVGAILKKQYYSGVGELTGKKYGLKHLLKQAQNGEMSQAMLNYRLRLYAQSGAISGEVVKETAAREKGLREERRYLGATHDHCTECLEYAARGWVPIGTNPPPKVRCTCGTNCKCRKEYR